MRFHIKLFFLLLALLITPLVYAESYTIDKSHSSVSFKIRHLVAKVQGQFNDFEGSFEFTPGDPSSWKANATIQAASIDTNIAGRDKHLRSDDFFDVENYPTLTFVSTSVSDVTAESAKLHGDLTIHGVTKPVTLDLDIYGIGKDPWGNVASGFSAVTKINRKEFGLNWNETLETGGLLVGEEVTIEIEVEGKLKE